MTRPLITLTVLFAFGCTPDREPLPEDHPGNPAAQEPPWTAPEETTGAPAAPTPSPGPGGHEHHGGGER